jgi:2-hydroxy-6-oxonona-2,4-dienedioate hydrolase
VRPLALETVGVPTLAIGARDDGFGTYAGAEYTASRIPRAPLTGYDNGGHLLVGRDEAVRDTIVRCRWSASPRWGEGRGDADQVGKSAAVATALMLA